MGFDWLPQVEVKEVEQVTFPAQETIDQVNHSTSLEKLNAHHHFPHQNKISALLSMLHEADPTTGEADPPDMPRLEQQVIIRRRFMLGYSGYSR